MKTGMESNLRVLFVNNFRGRGGGEEFLRDLLPGLLRKGVRVGLVCRPNTPLVEMFHGTNVDLLPLDRSGAGAITSVMTIARRIRTEGYQIVNIQRGHDIIQSSLAAAFSRKQPLLMYTPQVPEFIRSKLLLRRMDGIVTISRHIRDRLISFDSALKKRTSIIYYGIDLSRFIPGAVGQGLLRKRFGLPQNTIIIGTVGDLWKNQIEFLDTLSLLRKRFPNVRYAIVGSDRGDAVENFKKRSRDLGIQDTVLWPGRLAKNDMLAFYADIDLAVSTYRNEGFGIWLLEAMAMGKPAVAFDAGGIRDSLEGSPCGMLVRGGPKEMADTLSELLTDGQRLQAMADAAPVWVRQRFGRERMIEDYETYFRSVLSGRVD
jgi:glycosyltransferase involved in cell wall biosynthesis